MQTQITRRLLAPCSTAAPQNHQAVDVDVGAIIRNLILFDEFILYSTKLLEIPALVSAFGCDGLVELLKSGRLKIHAQSATMGQSGQNHLLRQGRPLLPLGSYAFVALQGREQQYLHLGLQNVHKANANLKDIIKIKRAIIDAVVPWQEQGHIEAATQLVRDLRTNASIIEATVRFVLKKELGKDAERVQIRMKEIGVGDFKAQTSLDTLGFQIEAEHKVIERALLGLGLLNQRIDEMRVFGGLSGFIEPECPLFTDRLGFLLQELLPDHINHDFARVVTIANAPEFIPSIDRINVDQFLRVLGSTECHEFRQWLRGIAGAPDSEIHERVTSLRAHVGSALQGAVGKSLRFVTSTAIGLIPGVNAAVGVGTSLIDTFLIERVLPSSGVWTFINRMYPSIFESKPQGK